MDSFTNVYDIVIIAAFILAFICLGVAVILFIKLRIYAVIQELSGHTEKKEIAEIRSRSNAASESGLGASAEGAKYAEKIFNNNNSGSLPIQIKVTNQSDGDYGGTQSIREENKTTELEERDISCGTVALDEDDEEYVPTDVLKSPDDETTTILDSEDENTQPLSDFMIIKSIVFIHTNEEI